MATLAIKKIRFDGGTQSRAEINPLVVDEYASEMKRGDTFPPIDVFYDGTDYWLSRGFHRTAASVQAGFQTSTSRFTKGTKRPRSCIRLATTCSMVCGDQIMTAPGGIAPAG